MSKETARRYAIVGEVGNVTSLTRNEFEGEVEEAWFQCRVDKKKIKQLMRRTDSQALRHFAIWLALLISSGIGAVTTWGTWWCLPFFVVYGVMYSMSDHHAHELSHGTPFKTRWLNEAFYHVNAFMTLHEGYYWRWSHTRHHTDTLLVGRDPEIALMSPPDVWRIVLDFFFIRAGLSQLKNIFAHATGRITPDGEHFVPRTERAKATRLSRIYIAVFATTIGTCLWFGSILPALLIVTPRFYGGFIAQFFNITQHAGLREDCRDHRQNTRTFLTNPVFHFLYMNMNYHIEHHMFPMAPFHALPALHEMIKDQCPPAYPSVLATYRDFVPALKRQLKDPSYYSKRPLPDLVAVVAAQ